jgi:hypothetical protein
MRPVRSCLLYRQLGFTTVDAGLDLVEQAYPGWPIPARPEAASRDFARTVLDATRLIAIIHPDNRLSQRVAEKIGLLPEKRATVHGGRDAIIYAAVLD